MSAPRDRILVVCPTRDRPHPAMVLAESIRQTSTLARVAFYIDEDQKDLYAPVVERYPESIFHYGPRIGPVASDNVIADTYRSFSIYGVGIDDARFTTPGWDEYLIEQIESFPNRIGVVSASHWENPTFVNFAYVSREWIDTLGWLAYPKAYHRVWDSVLQILGEGTNLVYARRDQFRVEHDLDYASNYETYLSDCEKFLMFCVIEKNPLIEKLRKVMNEARPSLGPSVAVAADRGQG